MLAVEVSVSEDLLVVFGGGRLDLVELAGHIVEVCLETQAFSCRNLSEGFELLQFTIQFKLVTSHCPDILV